jgi:hypothetical protein
VCVEGHIEITEEDDPPFLKVARGDEINEVFPLREGC